MSVCLSVCLWLYLYLSVCFCLYAFVSVCLSVYVCVCPNVCVCVFLCLFLCGCLSVYVSFFCLCLSEYISVSLCISFSLTLALSRSSLCTCSDTERGSERSLHQNTRTKQCRHHGLSFQPCCGKINLLFAHPILWDLVGAAYTMYSRWKSQEEPPGKDHPGLITLLPLQQALKPALTTAVSSGLGCSAEQHRGSPWVDGTLHLP